ncbi:MAG TPA: FAD-dependent monooxygenase [Pseudonocardiaceae bacterium]|nr:FAD-dependent monooxygenase [Pseudonocardiaceae bacterium]
MAGSGEAIVVGAGIGGLAAAVGLRRAGWRVRVFERAATPGEVGAGISLWSNALAALAELRVGQAIRDAGTMQGSGGLRTPSGRWLSQASGAAIREHSDLSILLVHRAELHRQLRDALPADVITAGANVLAVNVDGTVQYTVDNERHETAADLVVGADGLRSVVRQSLWPATPQPRYAGFTAWRGVTEKPFALAAQSETWGSGSEVGLTQLIDGRVYWFATGNQPEGVRTGDEHAEALRRFGGWHEPIGDVIRATAPEAVLRHDIYQQPRPLSAFARGRVALLGDAAHAITPNLGQGACLALEDAVVLAAELTRTDDVPSALRRYDAVRRPRAQRLSTTSHRLARMIQTRSPVVVGLRSALAVVVPAKLGAAGLARRVAWTAPVIDGTGTGR